MHRIFATAVLALVAGVLVGGCGGSKQVRPNAVVAYSNGIDIVLTDLDTGSRTTLVHGHPEGPDRQGDWLVALNPVWSPDGTLIAYERGARGPTSIWVVEVATGLRRRISGNLQSFSELGLRWSPDSRWVAFRDVDERDDTIASLWVARSDGGQRRLLYRTLRDPESLGTLGWAPDGRLVFHDKGSRLAARPASGAARPYTGPRFTQRNLGADGSSRLVVARDARGDDQVVLQRPPGARLATLTADRSVPGRLPIRSNAPSWSPDGRWIAFNRNGAVVVVDSNGRRERQLMEDGVIGSWSSDGRFLLVRSRLGRSPLWAFDPASGRGRLIAGSIVGRDVLYEHEGASWRPGRSADYAAVAPQRPLRHVVETPYPARAFALGHEHIEGGRHLPLPERDDVSDVSPNGHLLALWIPTGRFTARVAVFDPATGSMRDVGLGASPSWTDRPSFDRSGQRLLYRHWNELRTVMLASGRTRVVTTEATQGSVQWINGGGLAYVDRANTLVVLRSDGTVRRRTRLSAGEVRSLAVAPDGNRVLYTRGCDVWLADLRTGAAHRFAHAAYFPTRDSWSPTGRHIALASGWWANCDGDPVSFGWYHAGTALLDLRGRVLDYVSGGLRDWTANDRFVLTSGGVTGTETGGLQPLVLSDLKTHRDSVLLPQAATGPAFIRPGRRLVFGGFDNPGAIRYGGDMQPRLYIGRFTASP